MPIEPTKRINEIPLVKKKGNDGFPNPRKPKQEKKKDKSRPEKMIDIKV